MVMATSDRIAFKTRAIGDLFVGRVSRLDFYSNKNGSVNHALLTDGASFVAIEIST